MLESNTVLGILAHVDAGKTTLSEQMLYQAGVLRTPGRVDARTAFLDQAEIERKRGITVFSGQADFSMEGRSFSLIDTPGHVDFSGEMERCLRVLDCAVLVVDATQGKTPADQELVELFQQKNIPHLIAYNKSDLAAAPALGDRELAVSAQTKEGIEELKERIARLVKTGEDSRRLVGDLLTPGDLVVLVTPIDSAAPKGRLILPQQQTIRDVLDAGCTAIVVKETGLREALASLSKPPRLVITDSQAFAQVSQVVPEEILLTSFSILMARYKGFLDEAVQGAAAIRQLKDGDRVLISEGCTHHRQCDDIGTVKIPRWLKNYTGKNLIIETSSGREFPEDLSPFSLIIHCGGCMLNGREMKYRMKCAKDQHIPFTNYGIAIAHMQGILERSIQVFPDLVKKIKFDL